MRTLAVVLTAAIWLLFGSAMMSLGPFPAGERHCDATGCWQFVPETNLAPEDEWNLQGG